ncbi:MAG: hemerythrin domain-containing protein [Candidatus Roizmanbacteria bacterium]|nr:MAG: hemerythrin domain-containing protein [Candidatus Roizmanbacteria bacterium]
MNNSINDFMSRDHDRLELIFKKYEKLRQNKSSSATKSFSQFKRGLEQHIVWEEEILFPLFEDKTGIKQDGPIQVMCQEHKDIKNYLAKIINKIEKEDFKTEELENQLIAILSDHNHKEEMILYPWIDESVNEEEREQSLAKIKKLS